MTTKIALIAIICGMASACSGLTSNQPSQSDPEAAFYEQRCGSCHTAVTAEHYKPFQWERLLTLIERELDIEHQGLIKPRISQEEMLRLFKYLNNYAAPDKNQTSDSLDEQLRALGDSPQ